MGARSRAQAWSGLSEQPAERQVRGRFTSFPHGCGAVGELAPVRRRDYRGELLPGGRRRAKLPGLTGLVGLAALPGQAGVGAELSGVGAALPRVGAAISG